jgi:hypothetical protein
MYRYLENGYCKPSQERVFLYLTSLLAVITIFWAEMDDIISYHAIYQQCILLYVTVNEGACYDVH